MVDDIGDTLGLGTPVNGRKHKVIPEALGFKTSSDSVEIILGADGVHDAAIDEASHEVAMLENHADRTLGDSAVPECIVQVPDYQFYLV